MPKEKSDKDEKPAPTGEKKRSNYALPSDTVREVGGFLDPKSLTAYSLVSRSHRAATREQRNIQDLLLATVYGMESKEANVPLSPKDTAGLFKSHIYVKDMLMQFPELLLVEGCVTDWFGRTFEEKASAFRLAVWMQDWKMIETMLACVREAKMSDEARRDIFAGLREQYKQVRAPVEAGGGLTYRHTYPCPNLSVTTNPVTNNIPQKKADGTWDRTAVTEVHTSNHFDITPMLNAYQDYMNNYDARTNEANIACFVGLIGLLQRYRFTVPMLQRMCDPHVPFDPLPNFDGVFTRSVTFYNCVLQKPVDCSLFTFEPSVNFSLVRWWRAAGVRVGGLADLAAFRRLGAVSTSKIETLEDDLKPSAQNTLRP